MLGLCHKCNALTASDLISYCNKCWYIPTKEIAPFDKEELTRVIEGAIMKEAKEQEEGQNAKNYKQFS